MGFAGIGQDMVGLDGISQYRTGQGMTGWNMPGYDREG